MLNVINCNIILTLILFNDILGEKGTAYTLITKKEDKFAGDLVRNLESSGQVVPSSLMDLAMQVNIILISSPLGLPA